MEERIVSAIAGIFNLDAPLDAGACDVLVQATGATTPGSCRAEGRIAFARGASHGVLRVDAAGRMLLADARIDNATELQRTLGVASAASARGDRALRDADLILAAYARWGERCPEHLVGDFAFALWDPARQSLLCARDPMGVRPFYYWQSDSRFCFAFDQRTLLRLTGAPAAIDQQRVVHFLLNTDAGRERTFYQDVRRLPAAHRLLRTPAAMSVQRYWEPDAVSELRLRSDDEYAEAFRDLFGQAVRARLAEDGRTAATLSGGLDSSSIVCMARMLLDGGAPLHTISLVFPDLPADELRLIDERRYIATVARDSGVHAHAVRGDRISPLGDVRSIVQTLHEPFSAPNLYLHWAMFGAAADAGCNVFLDGFDGDSVVSHGLARFDDLLAAGDWTSYETLVRAFAARRGIETAKVARSFGVPRLDWLAANGRWAEWRRTARALHDSFGMSRLGLFIEHGMRPTRAGGRLLRRRSTAAGRIVRTSHEGTANQVASEPLSTRASHIAGLMQPAYQDTLEIAYHCSRAFCLDARFPFFDRRLIEFCVALPAEQKFADGWTRRVMRNAMRDVLPEEIRTRADKGSLLPAFHRGMRQDDASLLNDLDLTGIADLVDVELLADMRREYLDVAQPSKHGDPMLLLRCATLAVWMEEQSKSGQAEEQACGSAPHVSAGTHDGAAHAAAPRG